MVIYKQAMKKYLMAPSTWIVLVISFAISGFVAAYLPFKMSNVSGNYVYYGYDVILSTGVITSMLSIFSSIFAGFKASTMFRDEVENGTFLVMLSKPQSRFKIIFQKWLALQSMMLIFAVTNIVIYEVCVVCFDNYKDFESLGDLGVKPLSTSIFTVGGYLFLVLFVVGLIFSSIALLLSTRLSSTTTIGISIAIGVIVPITAMVGMFTQKSTYSRKNNSLLTDIKARFVNSLKDTPESRGGSLSEYEMKEFQDKLNDVNNLIEDPTKGLYHVGVDPLEGDKFNKYWPADFSYQLTTIGSLATDGLISNGYKQSLGQLGISSTMSPKVKVIRDERDPLIGKSVSEAEQIVFDNLKRTVIEVHNLGEVMENILINRGVAFRDDKGSVYSINHREENLVANVEDFIRRPVNVIINKGHMRSGVDESWYSTIPNKVGYSFFVNEVNKGLSKLDQIGYTASTDEQETYDALLAVVHNNLENFGYVKAVDYADKHILLWVYLAIAIALVPLSFLSMRKQDFR